jgi:hypothetical protein
MASADRAADGGLFGVAAAAHIAALPVAALLGLAAMLWVAEGRRSQVLPVVLAAAAGALVLVFACYGFSPDAFSYVFRSAAGFLSVSLDPARRFFSTLGNGGITVAAAPPWCCCTGRCANRATSAIQLRCFALWSCMVLVMTGAPGKSVAVGAAVSADVCGRRLRRRLRGSARASGAGAAGAIVLLQAVFCVLSLPGLL